MAANNILGFGTTASNELSTAAYSADAQRLTGNQPGVARSQLVNKALHQLSTIAAGVAQYIADRQATDVVDTLTPAQVATMLAASASGRLIRTLVFTRIAGVQNVSINGGANTPTGAGTYTPDARMAFIIAEAQGGGNAGAGGTLPSVGNISLGSPGGAGAYGKGYYSAATVGASQAITVGLAGAPVSGAAGGVGGASSVGALLSAPGGLGSAPLNNFTSATNANGNGSLTAAPTGANIVGVRGGCQGLSLVINTGVTSGILGGPGGASMFGVGGVGAIANTGGSAASGNYGSGGGGVAITNSAGVTVSGGSATDGVVIISEYAA